MNKKLLKTYFALLLSVAIIISSCKSDSDIEFGDALLYIPQAVVQSGGLNNNYSIKLGHSNKEDTIVAVGLYRSGLQQLLSASVDIVIDTDSLNYALSQSNTNSAFDYFKKAKELPDEYYSLPDTIILKDGERDTWVELKIRKNVLLDNWDSAIDKYILPVKITNPSRYKINPKLSTVFFVLSKQ